MSYGLILLAAALTCVSARFTVPVPIHYEIEAQFAKQSGVAKMRWDPTNYLTYLAAVYAQCSTLYPSNTLASRGRVPNVTAYTNLQAYFDPSLLQSNLAVFAWDVTSDVNQDAGSVDRDLRKLFGKSAGTGALANIASIDSTGLRNYDRFGCSIETTCKAQTTNVMTFVCIFGQTAAPRLVAGTGGNQPAPTTARPVPTTAARAATTTTRPRARPTVAQRVPSGGLFETYGDSSAEFYEMVVNDFLMPEGVTNYQTIEVVPSEQKLTAVGLCKYENNAAGFTPSVLTGFDSDVQTVFYAAAPNTMPSAQDMLASPMSDAAKTAIRVALGTRTAETEINQPASVACSWSLCSQKVVIGCAVWGTASAAYEGTADDFHK